MKATIIPILLSAGFILAPPFHTLTGIRYVAPNFGSSVGSRMAPECANTECRPSSYLGRVKTPNTSWGLQAEPALSQDAYQKKRESMVKYQIEQRGVRGEAALRAMRKVPRHLFVPESYQSRAYDDNPLPIGYGQTISQPYIVAYMTEAIGPKPHFKVLEIGTGSGYQAAVLAEIVDKTYTIEIVEELGKQAKTRLQKLGYDNIEARIGDGYYGWKEHAPYDAIIVTAAAEFIPPPLIEQLKPGGKMIIPVGSPFMVQTLMLVEKVGGKTRTKSLFPVQFVPFTRG